MRKGSVLANEFTVSSVCLLSNHAVLECRQLHGFVVKNGMGEQSVVTWSSTMAGYLQNEMYEQAVALF
ncbi:hypothetical protein MLD38_009855 [Melastoma candidum]|uniref:Uncharacterized protein n=1 Tax=Melastoma candidum TaxID=119954 RepID=A0ACB9RYI9_9MYRT|nr:hypothetical protein MLD38_009855 [Melastoma candidum]